MYGVQQMVRILRVVYGVGEDVFLRGVVPYHVINEYKGIARWGYHLIYILSITRSVVSVLQETSGY